MDVDGNRQAAQLRSAQGRGDRTRLRIITALAEAGTRGVQAAVLARRLAMARTTVIRHLNAFVAAGEVVKFPDPYDARSVRYRLNLKGSP